MDVFVAQAAPGGAPAFTTARVSEYASGFLPGSTVEQRLQFNPPNLPMFRQGAVPFMGDYIDLAPAPPFVLNDNGTWSFNTGANGSAVSHAVWTDNRDVRPPADGNWANYTPVTSPAVGTQSRFDPTQQVPALRARPGRDAQPEHLHGARHRRPVRVGAGQQQAVQRLSARLRRRRGERHRRCRAPTACASRTSRSAGRRRSCSSARR